VAGPRPVGALGPARRFFEGGVGGLGEPGGDLLFRVLRRSTIGAEGFHGRVRDGIGCLAPRCGHQAIAAPRLRRRLASGWALLRGAVRGALFAGARRALVGLPACWLGAAAARGFAPGIGEFVNAARGEEVSQGWRAPAGRWGEHLHLHLAGAAGRGWGACRCTPAGLRLVERSRDRATIGSSGFERLVPVGCTDYSASTSGLSTWWSSTALDETWF
jgi:hypothetical protein